LSARSLRTLTSAREAVQPMGTRGWRARRVLPETTAVLSAFRFDLINSMQSKLPCPPRADVDTLQVSFSAIAETGCGPGLTQSELSCAPSARGRGTHELPTDPVSQRDR
jgi:hypothetical protein